MFSFMINRDKKFEKKRFDIIGSVAKLQYDAARQSWI